jgi:hypothetical protein
MSRVYLALGLAAITTSVATSDAHAQSAFVVTGVAIDHESRPVEGRTIGASFSYDHCTSPTACTPVTLPMWTALSGTDGRFTIAATLPAQPTPHSKNQKLTVSTFGSEATVWTKRSTVWNADPAFWTVDVVIRGAPAQVSIDGGYWARRIGCGEYPVFVVEGFDPGDSMKTGDASDPSSWVGLLGASRLPDNTGLLDYFTNHNYSVYLLSSGLNSHQSIKASPDGNLAKGMAYQSVFLAKTILDQAHAGKPLVMGGYSAGGLTARAGLTKWCDGSYEGVSGGFLDAGCPSVSLWFSGDAPQKGATVPIALQRYVHDDDIMDVVTGVNVVQQMLDAPAAQEMLQRSLGTQVCNTNCDDMFGCESTDLHYMEECTVRTNVHDDFFAWVGGYPTRAGGPVPAIAFSNGTAAKDASGIVPKPEFCWDATAGQGKKFFETVVDCWGNHNMYVNTAGGWDECVPGSVVNSLLDFDGYDGDNNKCFGGWEIDVHFAPTYIPTDSALDWDNRDARWRDYWHADENRWHGGAIPSGAGGFLVAWITEYSTGLQDAPVCPPDAPPAKSLGLRGICRPPGGTSAETTLACAQAVEPMQALVGTHAWGTGTPAVGVLRTANFGAATPTFEKINTGLAGTALDVHGLELDPFDSDTAYIYTADGIYRNSRVWADGTWTQILTKSQFESAAGFSFPTGWSIVHAIPSPTVQGRIHAIVEGRDSTQTALEKRYKFFALVTHDGGGSWTGQQVGQSVGGGLSAATGGSFGIAPSPNDPAKVWLTTIASNFAGCNYFASCSTLWRSTDGGTTWIENTSMRFGYTRATFPYIPSHDNADNSHGFRFRQPVGGNDPTFNGSEDGLFTASWSLNPFVQVGGSWANWIRRPNAFFAEPTDRDRILAVANNVMIMSSDGGHNWVARTPPGIGNSDILERGTAPWKLVVASAYSYVWNSSLYTTIAYSKDLGKTWVKKNGNLKDMTTANTMSLSSVRIRP